MLVRLGFVPPGGGETDYSLDFDVPELPREGDYICINRPGQIGNEDFIVRRIWWNLETVGDENGPGKFIAVHVECEFALSDFSSESHAQVAKGSGAKSFDNSMY